MVLSGGCNVVPRGHLAMFGDSDCPNGGGKATGIWWVKTRKDAKYPTIHRTDTQKKPDLVKCVGSIEVEKSAFSWMRKTSKLTATFQSLGAPNHEPTSHKSNIYLHHPQVTLFYSLATFQARYTVSKDSAGVLGKKKNNPTPKGRQQIPKPVSEMINDSKY